MRSGTGVALRTLSVVALVVALLFAFVSNHLDRDTSRACLHRVWHRSRRAVGTGLQGGQSRIERGMLTKAQARSCTDSFLVSLGYAAGG